MTPKDPSYINKNIMPVTAGGTTSGKIIKDLSRPKPLRSESSNNAIAKPSTNWIVNAIKV